MTLFFEDILNEMARVGITDDGYEVWIRTDDPGKIPHFHYWDRATKGKKFHTCIKLEEAGYFLHEGKKDKLNSKQRKELVKLLSSSYKRDNNKTLFVRLLEEWNDNNSDVEVSEDTSMPDYSNLK